MRMRSIAVAISLAGMAAGFSPSIVSAEPPTPVVINAHPCAFYPAETGTWEAFGAIEDAGWFVRTDVATSPPDRSFLATGPFREEFIFTSTQGTFTINAEERSGADRLGVWQLKSGTGAFADASGHGEAAFFPTETPNSCPPGSFFTHFTFALTGVASKVG